MLARFTLDDFVAQMKQARRHGPAWLRAKRADGVDLERALRRIEAIYGSMTRAERSDAGLLDADRGRRAAKGAGVTIAEVSQFIKQFEMTRDMMHAVSGRGTTRTSGAVLGLVGDRFDRRDPSRVHPVRRRGLKAESLLLLAWFAAALLAWACWHVSR